MLVVLTLNNRAVIAISTKTTIIVRVILKIHWVVEIYVSLYAALIIKHRHSSKNTSYKKRMAKFVSKGSSFVYFFDRLFLTLRY